MAVTGETTAGAFISAVVVQKPEGQEHRDQTEVAPLTSSGAGLPNPAAYGAQIPESKCLGNPSIRRGQTNYIT